MNKKKTYRSAAVLDISSDSVKMRISQLKSGVISDIDVLEYPLHIGHEVYNTGKISFESIRKMSEILSGFSQVMKENDILQYRLVSGSVLREAENKAYVADQLKIRNDMNLEILDDDREKSLIYHEIIRNLKSDMQNKNSLISYIGKGSIGVAVYRDSGIVFSENIPIGSLKIKDILDGVQSITADFYTVLESYLDGIIGTLNLPNIDKFESVILTGDEIQLIARLCNVPLENGKYKIKASVLEQMYKNVRSMSEDSIGLKYNISRQQAETMYVALAIYSKIMSITKAKLIISPQIELWDALMRHMLFPLAEEEYEQHVATSALTHAKELSKRYVGDIEHCETVCEYACQIFDRLKKIHGLSSKRRLYLQICCIMHGCGSFINSKNSLLNTYSIIKNTDIYGLTEEDSALIATAASYDENTVPSASQERYGALTAKNKLVVSKLAAITSLALALDKSKNHTLNILSIRLKEQELVFSCETNGNAYLETWAFESASVFFEEVFGIKPRLVIKSKFF